MKGTGGDGVTADFFFFFLQKDSLHFFFIIILLCLYKASGSLHNSFEKRYQSCLWPTIKITVPASETVSLLRVRAAFSPKVIFHVYVSLKFSQIDINFILRLLQQSWEALYVLWHAGKPGFLDWLVISSRLGNL